MFCDGDSLLLYVGAFPSIQWQPRGQTDSLILVRTSGTYTAYVTDSNNCSGVDSISVTFRANPKPVINTATGMPFLCSGDTLVLDPGAYAQYSWSPGGEKTRTIGITDTGQYAVYIKDLYGCEGADSIYITPAPPLQVQISTDTIPRICRGHSVILDAGPYQSWQWSTNATTRQITVGISGQYHVVVTDSNGCTGRDTLDVIVYTPPTPSISPPGPILGLCSADSLKLDAGGPYTKYQWSPGTTSDTSRLFTPPVGRATYFVVVTDSNGCKGISSAFVEIKPTTKATFTGLDTAYCENADSVLLIGTPAGGNFRGSGIRGNLFYPDSAQIGSNTIHYVYVNPQGCPDTAEQVVNIFPINVVPEIKGIDSVLCANEGAITLYPIVTSKNDTLNGGNFSGTGIVGREFHPDSLPQGGRATITYIYNGGNGCRNAIQTSVRVKAVIPIAIADLDSTHCSNGSVDPFTGNAPSTALFLGPNVISTSNTTALFNPAGLAPGYYTISYLHPNANGCTSRDSLRVRVLAPPSPLTNIGNKEFCENDPNEVLRGVPAGGRFINSTNPASIINDSIFVPSRFSLGQNFVTYYYTDTSGCQGSSAVDTLTVHTVPRLRVNGVDPIYCPDGLADTLMGLPQGGSFLGPGMRDSLFVPPMAGSGQHTLSYTYADTIGCRDTLFFNVRVDTSANIAITGLDSTYCLDHQADTLLPAPSPAGVFSGRGMRGNIFHPDSAGPGIHTVLYTYTNPNSGCKDIDTAITRVDTLPVVSFVMDSFHCQERQAFPINGTPQNGRFIGSGIVGSQGNFLFDAGLAGLGPHRISYHYRDSHGCVDTAEKSIQVLPRANISIQGYADTSVYFFCRNTPPDTLRGLPAGGVFSLKDSVLNLGVFDPATADTGLNRIKYTFDDSIGCRDTIFLNAFVARTTPLSILNLGDSIFCVSDTPFELIGNPELGQWVVAGDPSSNVLDPGKLGVGKHQIIYTKDFQQIGCADSLKVEIEVKALPRLTVANLRQRYCAAEDSLVNLIPSPPGGMFNGPGIVNGTQFNPAQAGLGMHDIFYTYTDSFHCSNTIKLSTLVYGRPSPDFEIRARASACVGEILTFLPTTDTAGMYHWDFDDGDFATTTRPSHIYDQPGRYEVNLSIGEGKCEADTSKPVFIFANPEADFVGDTLVYLGDTAHFENRSRNDAVAWQWSMGDGAGNNAKNPSHVYRNFGTYAVEMIALTREPAFCRDTATMIVVVRSRPASDFDIGVYPNPARDQLYVNIILDGGEDVSLVMYDNRSRMVKRQNFGNLSPGLHKLRMNVGNLAEGIYVLAIYAGKGLLSFGDFEPGIFKQHKLKYNNRRKVIIYR